MSFCVATQTSRSGKPCSRRHASYSRCVIPRDVRPPWSAGSSSLPPSDFSTAASEGLKLLAAMSLLHSQFRRAASDTPRDFSGALWMRLLVDEIDTKVNRVIDRLRCHALENTEG